MKESDTDLYTPAGLWVTSYRILRFFDDGKLFSYLCAAQVRSEPRAASLHCASLLPPRAPAANALRREMCPRKYADADRHS
jgi:hypothetical protein